MKNKLSTRAQAAKILVAVLHEKKSLSTALNAQLVNYSKNNDRGFIQELSYGVMRWYEQLAAIVQLLMPKPLKSSDQDIYGLLLLGIYQLYHLKIKPHAAIYETAQAARDLKKPWAVGLINGILRSWQRQELELQSKINDADSVIQYAHPAWLVKTIQQAWPEQWQTILAANNERPPLILRVNLQKISRDAYLNKLAKANITARATLFSKTGIQLITPQDVTQLPGYNEGEFSVQDEAAQFAAELLELAPQQRILDACAAPGGKTTHILEIQPKLAYLLGLDNDQQRLSRVKDNLERLQLWQIDQVKLTCADATQTINWWNQQLFDRILLDAPCSATGVIRRHPDIKYLRRSEDIQQLNNIQLQLLNNLWPLLKPGGILVYVTCSILPQENFLLLEKFIAKNSDVQELPINVDWGIPAEIGRQILPGTAGMDGFYYAKLKKI